MKPTRWVLTLPGRLGLLALLLWLGTCHALGAEVAAGHEADWNNLKRLVPGQQIEVVETDAKALRGRFEGLSKDTLVIRLATGDHAISRHHILRVSAKGSAHRIRHALVLGAIFGAAGFTLAKVRQHHQKDCPPGFPAQVYPLCGKDSNTAIAVVTLFEAGTGALIGALASSAEWQEIYRRQGEAGSRIALPPASRVLPSRR